MKATVCLCYLIVPSLWNMATSIRRITGSGLKPIYIFKFKSDGIDAIIAHIDGGGIHRILGHHLSW